MISTQISGHACEGIGLKCSEVRSYKANKQCGLENMKFPIVLKKKQLYRQRQSHPINQLSENASRYIYGEAGYGRLAYRSSI